MRSSRPLPVVTREEELDLALRSRFPNAAPVAGALERLPYPAVRLSYLTVTQVCGPRLFLRDPHNRNRKFGPVLTPMFLWGLIQKGDTFLCCIALEDDHWELLYISPLSPDLKVDAT